MWKGIFERGITSTGSIIAPANWVPEMTQILKDIPPQDIGVHLTLTSEHKNLRWFPLSNQASIPSSTLVKSIPVPKIKDYDDQSLGQYFIFLP